LQTVFAISQPLLLKTVVKLAVIARSISRRPRVFETLRGMVRSVRRMYIKESGLLPSILHF
jgi:hypothetical protein